MIHEVVIGGRKVTLEWTQDIASRYRFRESRIGGVPSIADFRNPRKAKAAIISFLWLVLPPDVHQLFSNPEELAIAINEETEAEAIFAAVVGIIGDMVVTDEKKSTSKKSPSPKSS